ncbi:hypothetical protein ACEZCY_08505 [Streptacidiphilus sp. N1-12]|uniref:Uncharacterized protein n=2 Tax=Streptacidiphilus alkalitolerans TaxID=3342712 RepID=A0ABV6VH37_9ACTN
MTGIEIAVGCVFAWAVRKARRVGGKADAEFDRALDAGLEQVHELVSRKLGDDSVLQRVREEAEAGQAELSPRTSQRLALALEEEAERDGGFALALQQAVDALPAATSEVLHVHNEIKDGRFQGLTIQAGKINHLAVTDQGPGQPPPR